MKTLNYFFCCLLFFLCSISVRAQLVANAGAPQTICPGISVGLGGSPTASGVTGTATYSWSPNYNLSSTTASNPTAYPLVSTTYTVIVTDASGDPKSATITITVYNYSLFAGNDTTIQAGQTVTLHAQAPGYTTIYWATSDNHIYNQNTLTPDVFPTVTTTYTVIANFPNSCTIYDEIKITVIPSNNLFFYNTFTPNGDQSNDFFYIGNIERYPDNVLEIYNRYGQKVFNKTGYINDWDGKYLNDELPAGTYFYVLDTKSPSGGKYKGSVTIVR